MAQTSQKSGSVASELIRRLHQTHSIPALDENVAQLCRLTDSSETRTTDLTAVIMRDAALTSRLLAMANSAAYRPRNPVKTVSSAVILLGFDRVRQLAVGLSLFHKHAENIRDKELYRLLVCAYCTGIFAMSLARKIKDETPEELFVSALLHQLPCLILFNGFPDMYREMDRLIVHEKQNIDRACEHVFDTRYQDLVAAVAEHWNLPEPCRFYVAQGSAASEPRRQAVRLSVEMADLLFGNSPAGPQATAGVVERAGKLLLDDAFSLPDFVGAAAKTDPNLNTFFHLSEQDLTMMARIAEWGKVNSAEVANTLTASFEQHAPQDPAEEPLIMAHFLSELMIAVRNKSDVNTVLMLAQEGIFRCIQPECVIAAFVDREHARVQGRLYAGRRLGVAAKRYSADLAETDCLAVQNLQASEVVVASAKKRRIVPDDSLLTELDLDSVLLAPIRVRDRVIGQFFLGRSSGASMFSADDCLWMMAIAGHVAMAFEAPEPAKSS